ncbi:hypothetical protein GQ53DRAFT_867836 [Thozetella sp. PMI_491]|nr:hypothetical protein GQ53DRAFT_867836 [Thozetella sp. PMI_491]
MDKPRNLFKRFVSLGLPINGLNHEGETPALAFIRHLGELEIPTLLALADVGADFVALNTAGETLLHIIAGIDETDLGGIYYLIEPLLVERFCWLLERGLDPLTEDRNSRTCLDLAAVKGHQGILKLLDSPS